MLEMIEWNEKYSVNVSEIDEEHKKLIEIINKVIVARQHNNDPKEVSEILGEIARFALNHFKTEETYMIKFEYPEFKSHKKEHHDFSMKAVDYCNRVIKGDYQITDDLLEYLQQWLVQHIQETDKKYTNCFNKNGLE
jgi:hemerythrin